LRGMIALLAGVPRRPWAFWGALAARLFRALSSILRDSVSLLLLLLALAANVALFLHLAAAYGTLPAFLPLHFDASGQVDRIAFKSEAFRLPSIALLVLVANFLLSFLLHRREQMAARLLLGAALLTQLIFWWAAFNIIY